VLSLAGRCRLAPGRTLFEHSKQAINEVNLDQLWEYKPRWWVELVW